MNKATIADVATLAGVSIKTVSRVTNNEPNVRADTRVKVRAAIDELGYRPNPSARSLASRRSYLVGLLYDNPSPSYLINIQNGSLTTCRAEGYDLVIYPCDYRSERLTDDLRAMVRQTRVDGVILTPPLCDMALVTDALQALGVPFSRISPADMKFGEHSIVTNDRAISAKMTQHLLDLGHRDIAFVRGHPDHGAVCNRYDGYKDALNENEIPLRPELVVQGYNSVESGEACARELLKLATRPTAIFAANDDMAAGALRAAHALGIRVPEKLSVAGFDDTPIAAQVWPALTTIRQPIKTMAERATAVLLRQLAGENTDELARTLDCGLVMRDSTAAAPGNRG
ncbi:MAG: LacI family DNA-binding transcriptional regulator [Gammaproteobacteria bacterium]